ncbi:50S ribosomal protein L6 [Candidatus Gottesmanbacteria bacterium]|nr:50S ribosomal protein L6 [Candidatus Gottesmanbacteria bacterium]
MSRIGKMPIELPSRVTLEQRGTEVVLKGPKGELTVSVPQSFEISKKDNSVILKVSDLQLGQSSRHGLYRSLLYNAVIGVTKGWQKTVELVGVGYRAQGGGSEVTMNVGFSHPVKYAAPPNITFKITDGTKITIEGMDKKVVGEVAAAIRAIKPPEPYKGKGIRYEGEVIRKKAGKTVKAVGAPA